MILPSNLQTLVFGECFDSGLDQVTLPSGLQVLTFGRCFNQSLQKVRLPSSLQTLTFGTEFNQSLVNVLPSGLQTLNLGEDYKQGQAELRLRLRQTSFISIVPSLNHGISQTVRAGPNSAGSQGANSCLHT